MQNNMRMQALSLEQQELQNKWAEGSTAPTNAATHNSLGLHVNSHFDGGNIEVVDISDHNNIQVRIHDDPYCETDKRAHFQWFHFRVSGASQCRNLRLHIINAGASSFPDAWNGYQTCASYNLKDWFRVSTGYDKASGVLTFEHTVKPGMDAIYFAYFSPYTLARHQQLIADMQCNPRVSLQVLGQTLDGHDLDLLRLGQGESGEGKPKIWVIARQHPGESMAEWWIEGFLRRLTDRDDAIARRLLREAEFFVVPNMNPDGSWRGHLRTNASGANLNRCWANASMQASPEVYLVQQRMREEGVALMLDVHGDEELPYNFISGNEGIPSWTQRLASLQAQFCNALIRCSPEFQTKYGYPIEEPGTANMGICSSAVGEEFGCLAMTLEMPFKDTVDTPDPVKGWSPERSLRFGAASLGAILDVLPNLQ
ncbi:hypothetical protein WJX84_007495 [Apatococcus fuscideae]|uniref:Peptidase M14 domain-containing protein n=1 Tax=Apatococcus fuscideae TaxID=2026836 RepID=A0AAW1T0B5_9CHLO